MKKKCQRSFYVAVCLLASFVLWTILVRFVDVREIGPKGSAVGFATINELVHNLTGVNMWLYTITDWLGIVPIVTAIGFGVLGLIQLIKRKNLLKVDGDILALGIFYIIVVAVYVFFEIFIVNYRPVLIEGSLEASYPSSTTMLVMCVMPVAATQMYYRIKTTILKQCIIILIVTFVSFMVIGRLISGVHWFTDIIGGILISSGLVTMYNDIFKLIYTKT